MIKEFIRELFKPVNPKTTQERLWEQGHALRMDMEYRIARNEHLKQQQLTAGHYNKSMKQT